jgi:hypothetical protein
MIYECFVKTKTIAVIKALKSRVKNLKNRKTNHLLTKFIIHFFELKFITNPLF